MRDGFNPGGGRITKKKKGNAYNHLEKFTAVQQLALFAPNVEITIERCGENSPYYQASVNYNGETITAVQQGKKKAKQAICSKIIRVC